MVVINKSIAIDTKSKFQIIDISLKINEIVNSSKVLNGVVNIFSKHSTSGIIINENEPGLLKDIEMILNEVVPNNNNYLHNKIDNNGDSHLKSLFLGSSETIPIKDSYLDLGTWQSILFIELDGPRKNRTIDITIIGEN